MLMPAARDGDLVAGMDTHLVLVPNPPGPPSQVPQSMRFSGPLKQQLSTDVLINGRPAAVVDSAVTNTPGHMPMAPGTEFVTAPDNRGTVQLGSALVMVNGKGLARVDDPVKTCFDLPGAPAKITTGSPDVFAG
jgi:uncharacterized Zn-binding protein involved in type VI secretion